MDRIPSAAHAPTSGDRGNGLPDSLPELTALLATFAALCESTDPLMAARLVALSDLDELLEHGQVIREWITAFHAVLGYRR